MDLVLRGARVVDGTGAPPRSASVGVTGDRITAVGDIPPNGAQEIDLDGLVLAPGFVDIHTHYDAQVLWDRDLTPSSWHGVTTRGDGQLRVRHRADATRAPLDDRPHARERGRHVRRGARGRHHVELRDVPRVPRRARASADAAQRRRHDRAHAAAALCPGRRGDRAGRHRRRGRRGCASSSSRRCDAGAAGLATSKSPTHAGVDGKPVPSRLAEPDEVFRIAQALKETGSRRRAGRRRARACSSTSSRRCRRTSAVRCRGPRCSPACSARAPRRRSSSARPSWAARCGRRSRAVRW